MVYVDVGNGVYVGLYSDAKPTTAIAGSLYVAKDIGITYTYDGYIWKADSPFPQAGRITGVRGGWSTGSTTSNGTGLFFNVTGGNGTGVTNTLVTTSTDGHANQCTTSTTISNRAGWWGNGQVMRKFNPVFTTRFRLNQAQTASQGILYIGLVNQAAQPTAGTSVLSTYLDTKQGVLFGFRAADAVFKIMSNNAQSAATYTTAGTPSGSATDTSTHTLSIQITDSPAQINWWYDGVAMTSITDTTNCVPASTTALNPLLILEAQTTTSLVINEHWSQISQDWI